MPRVLLISLFALLLLLPATASGSSGARLKGTVSAKSPSAHLVAVKASRQLFSLRVPGSLAAIRTGQRVELRGSTLRSTRGSRVLATGVSVASSRPLSAADSADDELEVKGRLTSLSPMTVASGARSVSCAAPAGMSLAGLALGDLVEMKCDLVGGAWVVRKIQAEDEDDDSAKQGVDDDDDDHSGPGSGDDDHDEDD